MLNDDSNGTGTRPNSSLFPFDHAYCPNGTAYSLGYSPPVHSKLRSKLFLHSFPLSGALVVTSDGQDGLFPADFSLQRNLTLPKNRLLLG
jgi:hypothetical protein